MQYIQAGVIQKTLSLCIIHLASTICETYYTVIKNLVKQLNKGCASCSNNTLPWGKFEEANPGRVKLFVHVESAQSEYL